MNRLSKARINKDADSIIATWSHNYSTYRLKKVLLDKDSKLYADRFICHFSLRNADKVTLEVWRRYRHVLPLKGDIVTANIKKMINAVRRQITQAKKARANINKTVQALSTKTSSAFSRDL